MYEYNNFLYSSYSRFLSWTFIHPKSKEANKYIFLKIFQKHWPMKRSHVLIEKKVSGFLF